MRCTSWYLCWDRCFFDTLEVVLRCSRNVNLEDINLLFGTSLNHVFNEPQDSVFTVVSGTVYLNTHLTIAPNPIGRAILTAEMVSSSKASHSQVTSLLVARCHQRCLVLCQNLKFFEAKRLRQKKSTVCVYEHGFKMMTSCSFHCCCCCCCCCCLDPKMMDLGILW